MFNNFEQTFLISENIEGKLSLDVKTNFNLDKNYQVNENTLELDASCLFENGRLINFEPMQNLSKFIKRKELEEIITICWYFYNITGLDLKVYLKTGSGIYYGFTKSKAQIISSWGRWG